MPFNLNTQEDVAVLQSALITMGYLDPPADGGWGPTSKWAMRAFCQAYAISYDENIITPGMAAALEHAPPLPVNADADNKLACRIARAMLKRNYWIARHWRCVNIAYVEGTGTDGLPQERRVNAFDDLRVVFTIGKDGVPKLVDCWEATIRPSRYWTLHPMNPNGAFHIDLGQYKAWVRGTHHTHEALVQVGEIRGTRDPDCTYERDFHHPVRGSEFAVNQHWGYDLPRDDLGKSSAGCLVGRRTEGHREFMSINKMDQRFLVNPTYRFMTAVLSADEVAQA